MLKNILRVSIVFLAFISIAANIPECKDPNSSSSDTQPVDGPTIQCTDVDLDGYFVEAACGNTLDCDDSDPDNWLSCDTCLDLDGDSVFIGCDGYTQTPGPDCSDDDPDNWASCDTCADVDGDRYFAECDAYNNYLGTDCDDYNLLVWESCDTCVDDDEDGYFTGCDKTYPKDCNDLDPDIHPGAHEYRNDSIDSDCDGSDSPIILCGWAFTCGSNGIMYNSTCLPPGVTPMPYEYCGSPPYYIVP
jgi:Putative metal-binding motif